MNSLDAPNDEQKAGGSVNPFIFDISQEEFDAAHAATEAERLVFEKMKQTIEVYKQERAHSTVDIEVTEEAFNRLQGRPGFTGENWSRLVQIVDDGLVTYHVIPSASTNVMEIKKSGNLDRTELVLAAMGLNVFEGRAAF